MFEAIASLLAWFYDVWPSYGGAIFLFTLAIMAVTSPLSIKSTRSMIRMQRLQPEMKKLQTEYKGDREALNREMMAFYQANNVNPFSSCLPMLLQMPVFIVLFRVLSKLTETDSATGFFRPSYISRDSALYEALSHTKRMMSFGMDLSRSAMEELQDHGVGTALPFFVLVVLVVATQWYQQRQIQGRNPAAMSNPQQQMMTKVMPFIMLPFAIAMPAGVVIYLAVSNLARVAQQWIVTRLEYGGSAPAAPIRPTPTTKPSSPPPKPPTNGKPSASPRHQTGRVTAAGQAQHRRRKRK